jgi:hypothetical protein
MGIYRRRGIKVEIPEALQTPENRPFRIES